MTTDKYAGATPGPYKVVIKGTGIAIIAPETKSRDFPYGEHIARMTSGNPRIHANATLLADAWTLAAENAELRAALNTLLNDSECYCPEQASMPPCGHCIATQVIMKAEGR